MSNPYTSDDVRDWLHYLYPDELPALKDLVSKLPLDPIVLNIGAGGGTSGLAFMEARPDSIVVTVDVQDESSPFGCLEGERQVMVKAGFGKELNKRWFQVHMDSKLLASQWATWAIPRLKKRYLLDFVFIDGEHSYAGCVGDILGWLPWVKAGGLIGVHDYKKGNLAPNLQGPHPMAWAGVDQAVDELLIPYYYVHLHVDSLIVFRQEEK